MIGGPNSCEPPPILSGREFGLFDQVAQQLLGVLINLTLGNAPGNGGSRGSVVNHVGFIVNNVQEQVAKWKANRIAVLPGSDGRIDQAYVETPDGLRIEIPEGKNQAMPIRNEHVHLFLPEAEIAKAQAWYAKTRRQGQHSQQSAGRGYPRCAIRFAKADTAQAPTKGRVLDHYGFDVKDHGALVKKIEAEGSKLDEPPRKNAATGSIITYITDPWGARIELVQRARLSQ
jgi:catechol 2,3-dioxygenase-like lactoylglutathione lyase family enzyme